MILFCFLVVVDRRSCWRSPKKEKCSYVTQMELIASACRAWSFCSTFINWSYWKEVSKVSGASVRCAHQHSSSFLKISLRKWSSVFAPSLILARPTILKIPKMGLTRWAKFQVRKRHRHSSFTGTCSLKKNLSSSSSPLSTLLFKPNILCLLSLLFCIHKESNGDVMARKGGERKADAHTRVLLHAPKSARPFNHSSCLARVCISHLLAGASCFVVYSTRSVAGVPDVLHLSKQECAPRAPPPLCCLFGQHWPIVFFHIYVVNPVCTIQQFLGQLDFYFTW